MILPLILLLPTLISPAFSLTNPPPQALLLPPSHSSQNQTSSLEAARQNAPQVFNALYSAARQWGSSLNHNGMSFFPASIPANTHLYHGTGSNVSIKGMEWLAFEIEHAEGFARPRHGRPPKRPQGGGHGEPQRPPPRDGRSPSTCEDTWVDIMRVREGHDDDDGEDARGYLHIYKTKRELKNLLYIDGMSAGKTVVGTLDSQDLILSTVVNRTWYADYERAQDLCALGKKWGVEVEGFVRMEMGFEVILCAFEDGLELESVRQRPTDMALETLQPFEILRGASLRYTGLGAGRLKLDFSRMVSAFWYGGLNLTNPDPRRSDVPRLSVGDKKELERVKRDLGVVVGEGWGEVVDWQGVVDMIVLRYADRLKLMTGEETENRTVKTEIGVLLNLFIDYREVDPEAAIEKCSLHYLSSAVIRTNSDFLIYESILTVTKRICSTLFKVRELLLDDGDEKSTETSGLKEAKLEMSNLIGYLTWSRWLECGKCAYDEICFVAIWPWGSVEHHIRPRCSKEDVIDFREGGYWDMD